MGRPTWGDLLREVTARLGSQHEARRIVEAASGRSAAELTADAGDRATARGRTTAAAMVERRLAGEPLQYVVGGWGFRRLDLLVDRRVLIPRPETEQVVEVALAELRRLGEDRAGTGERHPVAVDLGTGSGAIALSLVAEGGEVSVWATDLSRDALDVAAANLAGIPGRAAARVRLAAGDWFDALPPEIAGAVDLIVSNPPYIAATEVLPVEVADWEPRAALVAGPTGLEAVSAILAGAPVWLRRPGAAVIEIAPHQAEAATAAARAVGFDDVRVERDLAGRERALVARLG